MLAKIVGNLYIQPMQYGLLWQGRRLKYLEFVDKFVSHMRFGVSMS